MISSAALAAHGTYVSASAMTIGVLQPGDFAGYRIDGVAQDWDKRPVYLG